MSYLSEGALASQKIGDHSATKERVDRQEIKELKSRKINVRDSQFQQKYIGINIVVDAYGNLLDGLITLTVSCCSVCNCVIVAICCFLSCCLLTLQLSPDAVNS